MYGKIFGQIFDSSIADNYHVRHFFMDLIVLADPNGVVDMTQTAISARTRIPLQQVNFYLEKLEQPDAESRTPDHDGRRIAKLDAHRSWGWVIINYDKFRRTASEEQRREKTRERTRKWRSKSDGDASVTHGDAGDAKKKKKNKKKDIKAFTKPTFPEMELYASKIGLPATEINGFYDHHEARGWKFKTGLPMKDWQAAMRTWLFNYRKWNVAPAKAPTDDWRHSL